MLAATGRSPMRASHLHFMVSAPGTRTLVTHIFVRGDELLSSDSVFGVKDSLVKDFVEQPAGTPTPDGRDLGDPVVGTGAVRHRPGSRRRLRTPRILHTPFGRLGDPVRRDRPSKCIQARIREDPGLNICSGGRI